MREIFALFKGRDAPSPRALLSRMSKNNLNLTLRGFGVAFGKHVVLAQIDLEIPARGVFLLVGPPGSGKSTLLRTLAGLNKPQPALRTWGEATFAGIHLGTEGGVPVAMVQQSARFLVNSLGENLFSAIAGRSSLQRTEQLDLIGDALRNFGEEALLEHLDRQAIDLPLGVQRRVAIIGASLSAAPLILIDEPTAGLDDEADCERILSLIKRLAEDRAVLVTTHHRAHARVLGGELALIAGGAVQERARTHDFLDGPQTSAGKDWLSTGHCAIPSPSARIEELAEGSPPPIELPKESVERVANATEPRGFFWLIEGQLAGTPRPGIVAELADDLDGIQRLGVDQLVTLEEHLALPDEVLRERGICVDHFPIPDMGAPRPAAAMRFCALVDHLLDEGRVIAIHCLAGLGRTGTMLAAYAIWRGASVLESIERVRSARPLAIQSETQVRFLEDFARALGAEKENERAEEEP